MTADSNLDPTENSEDDFILEDAPVQELEDLFQLPPQVGPVDLKAKQPQPADILFADAPIDETGAPLQDRPEFSEQGKSQWPGNTMTPSEMGLPVRAEQEDPLHADDGIDTEQELEVIGDDVTQETFGSGAEATEVAPAEPTESDLGAPEDSLFGKVRTEYPVEAGWEPVAHVPGRVASDASDSTEVSDSETELVEEPALVEAEAEAEQLPEETFSDEAAATDAAEETTETPAEEAESATFAEDDAEVETSAELEPAASVPPGRVIGGVQRRSRFTWIPMSAAAALLLGGGVVMMLRPDWLGLHFQMQLVDRVQVARPNVDLRTPTPPPVAVKPTSNPTKGTETPTSVPATTQPSVVAAPGANGEQPQAGSTGSQATEPKTTEPKAVESNPSSSDTQPAGTTTPVQPAPTDSTSLVAGAGAGLDKSKMLPVGETMFIGDFDTRELAPDQAWSGVGLGSKAFAQLRNGNYFVGSVKAVAASALVLRIGNGEITIPRADVEKITALDSEEYQVLQKTTNGVLRLNNRNRLVGTILKSVADDNYVLQMRSGRIAVPKHDVETIVEENADQLHFGTTQDEDSWLKQVAERQLYPNSAASKSGKVAPDPSTPANPAQVPNRNASNKGGTPQKGAAKSPTPVKKS